MRKWDETGESRNLRVLVDGLYLSCIIVYVFSILTSKPISIASSSSFVVRGDRHSPHGKICGSVR